MPPLLGFSVNKKTTTTSKPDFDSIFLFFKSLGAFKVLAFIGSMSRTGSKHGFHDEAEKQVDLL